MVDVNKVAQAISDAADKKTKQIANKSLEGAVVVGELSIVQYLDVKKLMHSLEQYDLLVGIPAETAGRNSGSLNNAELAYLQTHGVSTSKVRQLINEQIDKGMNYQGARKKVHQMWLLEHGSPAWRIPPRPIIEPAIESKSNEISKMIGESLKSFLKGDFEQGERKLKATGMFAQNTVREWFTNSNNNWAPNAPSTIKAKGSDRPLIDTGDLRKSITYVVKTPTSRYVNKVTKSTKKVVINKAVKSKEVGK